MGLCLNVVDVAVDEESPVPLQVKLMEPVGDGRRDRSGQARLRLLERTDPYLADRDAERPALDQDFGVEAPVVRGEPEGDAAQDLGGIEAEAAAPVAQSHPEREAHEEPPGPEVPRSPALTTTRLFSSRAGARSASRSPGGCRPSPSSTITWSNPRSSA